MVKRGEPLSVLGISERRIGACDLISMAPAAARTTRSAGDIPVTPAVTPLTAKQKAAAKKRAEKAARNQQLAEESSAAAEIATAEALLRTPIRPLQRPGSKLTDEQLNMLIELSVTLDKKAGEGGFTQDTMKDLMLHGLAPPDQTPRTDNRARTAPLDADLMIVAVTSDKYVTALADRYTADRLQHALSRPEYEQFLAGKGCMASSHVLSGYLRSCMADQNPSQSTVAFALHHLAAAARSQFPGNDGPLIENCMHRRAADVEAAFFFLSPRLRLGFRTPPRYRRCCLASSWITWRHMVPTQVSFCALVSRSCVSRTISVR